MQFKKWEKGLLRPDGQPGFNTPSGKFEIAASILDTADAPRRNIRHGGSPEPAGALLAMGLTTEEAHCTLRFSLGHETTADDIEYILAVLRNVVTEAKITVRFVPCRWRLRFALDDCRRRRQAMNHALSSRSESSMGATDDLTHGWNALAGEGWRLIAIEPFHDEPRGRGIRLYPVTYVSERRKQSARQHDLSAYDANRIRNRRPRLPLKRAQMPALHPGRRDSSGPRGPS